MEMTMMVMMMVRGLILIREIGKRGDVEGEGGCDAFEKVNDLMVAMKGEKKGGSV